MSEKGTLRYLPVLISSLIFLAACQPAGPAAPTSPRPSASASIPVTSTTGPTSQSGFDAAHVNDVLGPAVAEILVTTASGGGQGSGFAIQADTGASYIVTNNHVVEGARTVQVLMPDGRHFNATVQGTDPVADIAVVKVADKLPVAQFGDSSKVKVGQPVVAIGTPLGNAGSVTMGVVSALHRTILASTGGRAGASESLPDVLQTDAAINPGNSGGPLADGNGLVIGVNTAGDSSASGIGFAIPSLVARRIATALIAGQKPGHPYLGVQYADLSTALMAGQTVNGYGVVVSCVVSSAPAAKAGIQKGDVIEKIDGIDLNNGQTLGGLLQVHNPGDRVSMTLARNGSPRTVNVSLGDRPSPIPSCP